MEPGPFTLRELDWMASSKIRADWERTSAMMAMMVNTGSRFYGEWIPLDRFVPKDETEGEVPQQDQVIHDPETKRRIGEEMRRLFS